jgi:RNA polymerase sigma-70 factor (ECF subfamily)
MTLEAQDRARWDRKLIADGVGALALARAGSRSALLLQAELAARHATAPSFATTDWTAIVALYDELAAIQDSPVVALNRAVAVAMVDGPEAALPLLDQLAADPALGQSHRVWAVRADLHHRAGDARAALADYDVAIGLVSETRPNAITSKNPAASRRRNPGRKDDRYAACREHRHHQPAGQ